MKKFLCLALSVIYLNIFPVAAFALSENNVPDYQNLVNLEEKEVNFSTKLSNKYVGRVFILTNNYEKPVVVKSVELTNSRGFKPVYKNSQYVMTPGSFALCFVGGLLSVFTFGISLALMIPAMTELSVKNNKVKNEAKSNITTLPTQEVTLESAKSIEIKAIFDKTQAVNRQPNIIFNCYDPESKQEFVITRKNENIEGE